MKLTTRPANLPQDYAAIATVLAAENPEGVKTQWPI